MSQREYSGRGTTVLRHFYVAVASRVAKQPTLVDLLAAVKSHPGLSVAICCRFRDSLDEVVRSLVPTGLCHLALMHCDMSEADRDLVATEFKHLEQAGSAPAQQQHAAAEDGVPEPSGGGDLDGVGERLGGSSDGALAVPRVLVMTDAGIQGLRKELLPLGVTVTINYDLPQRKEAFQRRIASTVGSTRGRGRRGSQGIVISFIVASEAADLRALEQYGSAAVKELPVHVTDIFIA